MPPAFAKPWQIRPLCKQPVASAPKNDNLFIHEAYPAHLIALIWQQVSMPRLARKDAAFTRKKEGQTADLKALARASTGFQLLFIPCTG